MRFFFGSIAPLLLGMLVLGCNTVDPSECWLNTSGGLGGTIPIGAGVGATTSGDFIAPPPKGPLDDKGTLNPCVTPSSPDNALVERGRRTVMVVPPSGVLATSTELPCASAVCLTRNGPSPSVY